MNTLLRGLLGLAAALVLAGCGGGAGPDSAPTDLGTAPVGKSTLTGDIVTLDGQTAELAGVRLRLEETGQLVTSDADGWFTFGEVPAGTLTIQLADLPVGAPLKGGSSMGMDDGDQGMGMDDGAGSTPGPTGEDLPGETCDDPDHFHHGGECFGWDEIEDGEHAGAQEVHVHRTQDGERVHLRLHLSDGQIDELDCLRDSFEERETERALDRHAGNDDPDMHGRVELEARSDRERLRIHVEDATEGRQLELVAISPEGVEEVLGIRTVDTDGECQWTFDSSDGARLPFRVASLEDLAGYRLEIRDLETGEVLLEVELDGMPPTMDHWADCDEDVDHDYGHGMGMGDDQGMGMDGNPDRDDDHEHGAYDDCEDRDESDPAEGADPA